MVTAFVLLVGIWLGFGIYFKGTLEIATLLLFLIALILAMILNFILLYCMGCAGFWMVDAGASIFMLVSNIVSGGIFPLDIFGTSVQTVLRILPFGYTNYFCSSIICNRLNEEEILQGFFLQIFWIVVCYFIYRILWKKGLKRYVAVGG